MTEDQKRIILEAINKAADETGVSADLISVPGSAPDVVQARKIAMVTATGRDVPGTVLAEFFRMDVSTIRKHLRKMGVVPKAPQPESIVTPPKPRTPVLPADKQDWTEIHWMLALAAEDRASQEQRWS